jgi:hypothetical protein
MGALVVVAGLALAACGGGGDGPETAPEIVFPTITNPSAGSVTSKEQPPQEESTSASEDAPSEKRPEAPTADSGPPPQSCLKTYTRKECKQMAAARGQGPSPLAQPADCLKTHTREQCKEMAAVRGQGPSPLVRPEDCLKTHTRKECEAMVAPQQ